VSYKEVKLKVFDVSCVSCHGESGGIDLDSYSSVVDHLQNIKNTTVLRDTMPKAPYKKLTPTQRELLSAWIEAGGPERPLNGTDPGEIEPIEIKPTYSSIKKEILDKKCLSCHGQGGSVSRIPMETRENLLDPTFEIVIPGNAVDSAIMFVVEPGARKFMPPAKSGISPVNEDEKRVIKEWIENGAP
jgi:uncharacterized membrane protein